MLAHPGRYHIFFPLLTCYALKLWQGIHFLLSHTVADIKHHPPSRMLCSVIIVCFRDLPTLLLQHPKFVPVRYDRLRDFQGWDCGLFADVLAVVPHGDSWHVW